MKKLAVLDAHLYPEGAYDDVAELCRSQDIEFTPLACKNSQDIIRMAQDMDVCLCNYLPMNGPLLDALPKLKMVVRCGIGVDNLDIDAFSARGVFVCNVPDYGVEEVAVHALSLMMSIERKTVFYDRLVHAGRWEENTGYPLKRLSKQTLGFLGFGRTARKLSAFAKPLYGKLIAYDPYLPAASFHDIEPVGLNTLLSTADTLVVMAPLTEETRHIINAESLQKTKPGLRLVNVARGGLVDIFSLKKALDEGLLSAVALDVLEAEPPTEDLLAALDHPDIVLTPHVAYRSEESLAALKKMSAETAIWFMKGCQPYHVINTCLLDGHAIRG